MDSGCTSTTIFSGLMSLVIILTPLRSEKDEVWINCLFFDMLSKHYTKYPPRLLIEYYLIYSLLRSSEVIPGNYISLFFQDMIAIVRISLMTSLMGFPKSSK